VSPVHAGRFADLSNIGQGSSPVDLREYARHRHTIAFKATEGTGFHDPSFPGWWREAGRLGLHRIAYLFAHFHETGHADAAFFLRYVFGHGVRRFHDLPVIDLEVMDAPAHTTVLDLHRCCHTLARHWRPGWVYCSSSFIVSLGVPELPPGWRWWIADYADSLWIPAGIPNRLVAAWQHTATASRAAGVRHFRAVRSRPLPAPTRRASAPASPQA
jgi:GH25 family lysozyme M1 (1,4-beta-N-acetylmuramidase)